MKKHKVANYLGLNFEIDDLNYCLEYSDPNDFLLDTIIKSTAELQDEVFNNVGEELATLVISINEAIEGNLTLVELYPVLEKWKSETKTISPLDGFDTHALMQTLKQEFSIPAEDNRIYDPTLKLLEAIKEKVNIDDQEIPIIVYQGSPKHLPEIFERINTGSVQLSKYQILAAQWVDVSVRTQEREIIQSIQNKHQSLEEKGFRIDIWDESRSESEFSLYEYLFGMGKVIAEKFPLLSVVIESSSGGTKYFSYSFKSKSSSYSVLHDGQVIVAL